MASWSITKFKILSNYQIQVEFADGTAGITDLSPRLSQGPLGDGYDPLCDQKLFSRAYLERGTLTWPGGIDWHRMRCTSGFARLGSPRLQRRTSGSRNTVVLDRAGRHSDRFRNLTRGAPRSVRLYPKSSPESDD
jgi:hypothetical protein